MNEKMTHASRRFRPTNANGIFGAMNKDLEVESATNTDTRSRQNDKAKADTCRLHQWVHLGLHPLVMAI